MEDKIHHHHHHHHKKKTHCIVPASLVRARSEQKLDGIFDHHVRDYQAAMKHKFQALGVEDAHREHFRESDCIIQAVREGVHKFHAHSMRLNMFYGKPGESQDYQGHLSNEQKQELSHIQTVMQKHGEFSNV